MAIYKILPLLDICPILQEVTQLENYDTSINRCGDQKQTSWKEIEL